MNLTIEWKKVKEQKRRKKVNSYSGMKITVMGLGLNGGGLESARYLTLRGAECTVTDIRDEAALEPSIVQLEATPGLAGKIRYVLGRHETADFARADMVIKNPGVRQDSPYLAAARRIETDISLFLAASPARLFAVTGSKGKSGTASALYWALDKARKAGLVQGAAQLGGNIAVSPLGFLDGLGVDDDVVLELSSWQLGDLRFCGRCEFLKPRCAIITAIMSDHQDRYGSMEEYVNDKREIYRFQDRTASTIVCCDDSWGKSFLEQTPARALSCSDREGVGNAWIGKDGSGYARRGGETLRVLPAAPVMPGRRQKKNLLAAALALMDLGFESEFIRDSLGAFPGIEHRLELFAEKDGITLYNDTAATVPEAAEAAVEALAGERGEKPLILVSGGADKNLDFTPLVRAAALVQQLILLEGSGSAKLVPLLAAAGISFLGPFGSIEDAARAALQAARTFAGSKSGVTVALSPGCASFGMFLNEFERGQKWKEVAKKFLG
jgi:UDP-N-acetylmuramoylalanine--D-glutamate ligase